MKINNKKVFFGILIAIGIVLIILLSSLLEGGSDSKAIYGNRLDGINDVKITDKKKDAIKSKVEESGKTEDVTVKVQGKIINLEIKVKNEVSRDDAKNLAGLVLESLNDDEKKFYDIQLFIDKDNAEEFPIIAYRHHNKDGFSWTLDR